MNQTRLFRLLWLSIAAAVATISLKTTAYLLTGSVGLLSDAAESIVNLVAAVVALLALRWATKPADEEHAYGHQIVASLITSPSDSCCCGPDARSARSSWRPTASTS